MESDDDDGIFEGQRDGSHVFSFKDDDDLAWHYHLEKRNTRQISYKCVAYKKDGTGCYARATSNLDYKNLRPAPRTPKHTHGPFTHVRECLELRKKVIDACMQQSRRQSLRSICRPLFKE